MYTPNYVISNYLLKYIGRIEACKEVITNSPLVPAWEQDFRQEAHVRSVFHGTHLEGNELTKEQAERIVKVDEQQGIVRDDHGLFPETKHVFGDSFADSTSAEKTIAESAGSTQEPHAIAQRAGVMAKTRDIQELLNYRSLLEWIDQQSISQEQSHSSVGQPQYSEDLLKQMHSMVTRSILPEDQIGQYRKNQVVVRSVETGEIAYRPPLALDVPSRIQEFFQWLNSDAGKQVHPVLRAGITHYQLVAIHPFIEGNGRTARAFATYVLYREGYDVKRFFSLEEYFDKDIEGYYKAILSVQQSATEDMTYWLEYFSFGLAVELDRIKSQVMKLSQDMRLKSRLGGTQVALSERQILLLEQLQQRGELSTAEANALVPMVSPDTILRDLKDLIDKGIIRKSGVTKGVRYTLNG